MAGGAGSAIGFLRRDGVGWTSTTPDAESFHALLYGPHAGQSNHSRFNQPDFNRLYETARKIPVSPERDQLLLEMNRVFLAYALARLNVRVPWLPAGGASWWPRTVGDRLKPLFAAPTGWRGYALGVALGFLPCGLLYGAIAAAAATGTALAGALAMAAFAAGTVPTLLAVGLGGHLAARRWQAAAARALPILMLVNAAVLAVLAWRMAA